MSAEVWSLVLQGAVALLGPATLVYMVYTTLARLRRKASAKATVTMRYTGAGDWEATMHRANGTVVRYMGSCTVWYELPHWRRAGTSMEGILCAAYDRARHQQRMGEL